MAGMRDELHAPVLVGVGAAFDFHAGLVPQAPRVLQDAGLEWAFSPDGDSEVGAALTAAAVPLWVHLSLFGECRERAAVALARLDDLAIGPTRLRMQLTAALGCSLMYSQGRARDAGPAGLPPTSAESIQERPHKRAPNRAMKSSCSRQVAGNQSTRDSSHAPQPSEAR